MKRGTWGGQRPGGGRKPKGDRAGVAHRERDEHDPRHPVYVKLQVAPGLPSLREKRAFGEIRRALGHTMRSWFRVVHFSAQDDHMNLLVEARDKTSLSRGISGLSIRLARAVNRVWRRQGHVWGDRYDTRALRTPIEVRHALVYVLASWKMHVPGARGVDPCSSAVWFQGWKGPPPRPTASEQVERPVEPPETPLLSKGWLRYGPIGQNERPKGFASRLGAVSSGAPRRL